MRLLHRKNPKTPKPVKQPVIENYSTPYLDKRSKSYHKITMTAFAGLIGVIGAVTILSSDAATRKYIGLEAETATISGNVTTRTDTGAAGGKAVRFDAPPPIAVTPPPAVSPPPPAPAPDPTYIAGWGTALFKDEFSGSSVDTSRWGVYHNNYGSGNNQLECNTPSNVVVSGGYLTITGKKQTYACPQGGTKNYTSGFLGSRDASTPRYYPLYSRFEIRAKVPHGQGLWPAFWLRHKAGASAAEVDIVELFHNQLPGKVTHTLHFPNSIGPNVSKKSTALETAVQGTGNWHTYAVEITPSGTSNVAFKFFVDGVQTLTYTNTNSSSWRSGYESAAWDVAINLAIGGNWVGNPDSQLGYLPYVNKCSLNYSAPANNDPNTCPKTGIWFANLPNRNAVYQIDYMRVWDYGG